MPLIADLSSVDNLPEHYKSYQRIHYVSPIVFNFEREAMLLKMKVLTGGMREQGAYANIFGLLPDRKVHAVCSVNTIDSERHATEEMARQAALSTMLFREPGLRMKGAGNYLYTMTRIVPEEEAAHSTHVYLCEIDKNEADCFDPDYLKPYRARPDDLGYRWVPYYEALEYIGCLPRPSTREPLIDYIVAGTGLTHWVYEQKPFKGHKEISVQGDRPPLAVHYVPGQR